MNFKAKVIAGYLQGTVEGDPEAEVNNVARIESAGPGTLAFLANPKYEKYIYGTGATIVLVNNDFKAEKEIHSTLIRVENAYEAFASLLQLYQQNKPRKTGIHKQASVHESARVGKDVYIGEFTVIEDNATIGDNVQIYPQVYIGEGVEIGEGSILYPGVRVYEGCKIGRNVILHAGVIIGADGFGFAPGTDNRYKKIPQIGIVILEDDVEIGANSCVDRATMGATIIHQGVKLDNLIQIGHNVEIGKNTVIAAQTGIAGSTKIGQDCMFAAQVGIIGHINIGNGVKIGGQSGVLKDAADGETLQGSPATHNRDFWKSSIVISRLPELNREIAALKKEVAKLRDEKK